MGRRVISAFKSNGAEMGLSGDGCGEYAGKALCEAPSASGTRTSNIFLIRSCKVYSTGSYALIQLTQF